ncbi:MDR/zinc-dependent alcohol dehydrogenase-like family protein [Paracoccus sp. (in: a-proteobacteria)]|uniref:MDR/zinc-dependent alcohol dehydrogenase-like family protein n=1 Tax=Paracoccus sp. TaxID=267 RepID=UPI00396CFD27
MIDASPQSWTPMTLASQAPRAARIVAPGQVEIVPITPRDPEASEIRIAIEGCGVCASNLGPWAGPEWMNFPLGPGELGHEAWGIIEAVGRDVQGLKVGQRVAFAGQNGFATHETVPASDVIPLPEALAGQPVPAEPLGCAVNVFRRAAIRAGDTVAIIGIGFLGALLVRQATLAGARVIAISRRDSSLDLARQMGAEHTVVMDDHWRIIEDVKRLTGERLCDVVIEVVGKQWPLDLAGELVREGGRLVIGGYHQDGPRQVNMQMWNWKGMDVINAHERDQTVVLDGMRHAVQAVADGQLDPSPLYSRTFPLEDLAAALDATRDKPGTFVKAVIACN